MNEKQITKLASVLSEHRGLKLSTIGAYALRDGKFFKRLDRGGGCTLRTAARLTEWLSQNWAEDLEWPSDIPRPDQAKKRGVS